MMTSKNVIDKFLSEAPNLMAIVSNDFGELSEEQLNRKPSPDKWGAEERIDHLVVSHNEHLKNIRKFNVGGISPGNDIKRLKHNLFGNLLLKSVSPGATRKVIQEEGKAYKY